MFGFPVWQVYVTSVILCIPVVLLLFKSRGSRARAFVTLVPLPLLGLAVYQAGARIPIPSEVADIRATPESYTRPSTIMVGLHDESEDKKEKSLLRALASQVHAIAGLQWPDKGKTYTPTTLWNRIDGAAEIYKRFGFRRALFATAQVDGNDIDIQLFDLGTTQNAQRYFAEATKDSETRPLPNVGHKAVLWEGGGELYVGRIYGRVVLTTGGDIPEVAQTPELILRSLGAGTTLEDNAPGAADEEGQQPKPVQPASDVPKADSEPNHGLAGRLGIDPGSVKRYGIVKADTETIKGGTRKTVTHTDSLSAGAFVASRRTPKSERLGLLGFKTDGEAAIAKGKYVVWITGPNAAEQVLRLAKALPDTPIPGTAPMAKANEMEVLLTGWSGRAFLGKVLIARWEDGTEAFVAQPTNVNAVMNQLKASFPAIEGPTRAGIFQAGDPYLGDVVFGLKGGRIAGVAGYEDGAKAKSLLRALLTNERGPIDTGPADQTVQ